MDNKINLSQLSELLAQAGGMSKTASEQFVKSFFDIISQGVLDEGLVKVKGLGTFKLLQMEDRESVNVNTGERFTIEGHQKISFVPDADLKERINKPFASFDTVEITQEQAAELAKMEGGSEAPSVKEVTQKKGTRFFLKLLIWIVSIVLVIALSLYLLWPIVGNDVTEFIDQNIKHIEKTEKVVPVKTEKAKPAPAPVKAFEQTSKPAEAVKPAEPAKPAETAKPATPAQTEYKAVKLNAKDEAKDLTEFTEADTLNFVFDGEMTVHTLQKGETITVLALKYYGSKKLWPYIVKYNNIKNTGNLKIGSKIKIPVLKAK